MNGDELIETKKANNLKQSQCAWVGVVDCREVEILNLSNARLHRINTTIGIYQKLKEINLSHNNLICLPIEFYNLKNLRTCILSFNRLLHLPDDIHKLTKLVKLYVNDNRLSMLPDTLHEIASLRTLDLYNNNIHEGLTKIDYLEELDFAQNYFEEPDDEEYFLKKKKLRVNILNREDGRKVEMDSEDSKPECLLPSDDKELNASGSKASVEVRDMADTRHSSPDDSDSDDNWVPQLDKPFVASYTPPRPFWLSFVIKKMEEGNFCPIDAHVASMADIVKYERYINPPVEYESDGQFDDYSDDNS